MIKSDALLEEILKGLPEKQREVLVSRYGLDLHEPKTLAAIGEKFQITRERIRQIESAALKIVASNIKNSTEALRILEKSQDLLRKFGGVAHEDIFLREHKNQISDLEKSQINLLIDAAPYFYYQNANKDLHGIYYLTSEHLDKALKYLELAEKYLDKNKSQVIAGKISLDDLARELKLEAEILKHHLKISKKFKENPYGDFGLAHWEEVHPRTINQKAYLILKKENKPLHFKKIAELINERGLGQKKALPQTVHNELIKDKRFVLVGRGIYALKEQGYEEGTAREIIQKILKTHKALTAQEIIDLVLKQRLLKVNTILINLQNKKYFKRLSDGRYSLK